MKKHLREDIEFFRTLLNNNIDRFTAEEQNKLVNIIQALVLIRGKEVKPRITRSIDGTKTYVYNHREELVHCLWQCMYMSINAHQTDNFTRESIADHMNCSRKNFIENCEKFSTEEIQLAINYVNAGLFDQSEVVMSCEGLGK